MNKTDAKVPAKPKASSGHHLKINEKVRQQPKSSPLHPKGWNVTNPPNAQFQRVVEKFHQVSQASSATASIASSISLATPRLVISQSPAAIRGKVFISYAWGKSTTQVRSMKNYLENLNYKVWLDVRKLAGDIDNEMTKVIDDADVVIIFFGREYNRNSNCRKEAEYADFALKPILPIRLHTDCEVTGWLYNILKKWPAWVDFTADFEPVADQINRNIELMIEKPENQMPRILRYGKISPTEGYVYRTDDEIALQGNIHQMVQNGRRGTLLVIGEGGIGKTTLVSDSVVFNDKFLHTCGVGTVIWLNVQCLKKKQFESHDFYTRLCRMLNVQHNPNDTLVRLCDRLRSFSPNGKILIVLDDVCCRDFFPCLSCLGSNVYTVAISRPKESHDFIDEVDRVVTVARMADLSIAVMLEKLRMNSILQLDRLEWLARYCYGLPQAASIMQGKFILYDAMNSTEALYKHLTTNRALDYKQCDDETAKSFFSELILYGWENEDEALRDRCNWFLLFDKGLSVDLDDLAILWQCDDHQALQYSMELCDRNLARDSYSAVEGKEHLAIHDSLYDSMLNFATTNQNYMIAPDFHSLREKLIRQYINSNGENIMHVAIRLRRESLLAIIIGILKRDTTNRSLLFDVCNFQASGFLMETPLHYLFRSTWLENKGTEWERDRAFSILCEIVALMLTSDKYLAITLLKRKNVNGADILAQLFGTVEDNRKSYRNALLVAAYNDDCEMVRTLLELCANINVVDDKGNNALIMAICGNATTVVSYLIRSRKARDLDINQKNKDGDAALIIASKKSQTEIVRLLLQSNKCDINLKGNKGRTALMWAASNGCLEMVNLLLENFADVNEESYVGDTALWRAILSSQMEVQQVLQDKGATIDYDKIEFLVKSGKREFLLVAKSAPPSKKPINRTILQFLFEDDSAAKSQNAFLSAVYSALPLETASYFKRSNVPADIKQKALLISAYCGYRDIIKIALESKVDIESRSIIMWTPLLYAAHRGLEDIVDLLLKNRANANAMGEGKETALILAAQEGHENCVKLLLEHGASVDAMSETGLTALMFATVRGCENVVKLLIDHNADVDTRNERANTPLMLAALKGYERIAKLLIDSNAAVDARNLDGRTALMAAAQEGNDFLVTLLLSKNALITAHDCYGNTPLIIAAQHGHESTAKILIAKNADMEARTVDGHTALMCAAEHGHESTTKFLLDKRANLEACNGEGNNSFLLAVKKGRVNIVKCLLDYGASIDERNPKTGYTSLMIAVENGNLPTVKLLLEKGSDINAVGLNGENALGLAAQNNFVTIVQVLLDHGANIDARNGSGTSALMHAALNGHADVLRVLLGNNADQTAILVMPITE